jgi:hypothetical protein
MTVALGTTLIDLGIKTLVKFGGWDRIEDAYTTGTDIFIGAGVTRFGETKPNIDLCAEVEVLWGFVLGYNKQLNTIDSQGYFYRDYDNPFVASKWVLVGIPKQSAVYLILSATNTTIAIADKLKCVDGVFAVADTNDNYQMIAEEAVTAAANTRKYFYARWVKS